MPHPDAPISRIGPRTPGRPPKDPDEVLITYGLRLNRERHAKLAALGGRKWVEQALDAADLPRKRRA